MAEYDGLTVAELKDLLREAGLPVSGKKAELIARLEEAAVDAPAAEEEAEEFEEEEFDDSDLDDEDEWDDEEMFHIARQKPELDEATKAALEARKSQYKKQPKFRRQEWFRYKRLSKTGWRKPKGYQSSQRLNRKYRSPMARIGYGKVVEARGLHPSGFSEVMVYRPDDLEKIDPKIQAARIGRTVGNRKRATIHEKADELGIRILNRRRGI